jgi:hypothetical protein
MTAITITPEIRFAAMNYWLGSTGAAFRHICGRPLQVESFPKGYTPELVEEARRLLVWQAETGDESNMLLWDALVAFSADVEAHFASKFQPRKAAAR